MVKYEWGKYAKQYNDLTLDYILELDKGKILDHLVANHIYNQKYAMASYSTSVLPAMEIAEKMKLAIVPQSGINDSEIAWYVLDLKSVSYTGENVTLTPLNESGISQLTLPEAICKCALISKLNLR